MFHIIKKKITLNYALKIENKQVKAEVIKQLNNKLNKSQLSDKKGYNALKR